MQRRNHRRIEDINVEQLVTPTDLILIGRPRRRLARGSSRHLPVFHEPTLVLDRRRRWLPWPLLLSILVVVGIDLWLLVGWIV